MQGSSNGGEDGRAGNGLYDKVKAFDPFRPNSKARGLSASDVVKSEGCEENHCEGLDASNGNNPLEQIVFNDVNRLLLSKEMFQGSSTGAGLPLQDDNLPKILNDSSMASQYETLCLNQQAVALINQIHYKTALELLELLYSSEEIVDKPILDETERTPSGERGISLIFLQAFADFIELQGGDPRADMGSICRFGEQSVCNLTKSTGLSLVESCIHIAKTFSKDCSALFGKATTLFSYSWDGSGLSDVVEALGLVASTELKHHAVDESRFWIDIFCVSQNLLAGKYEGRKENTDTIFTQAIDATDSVAIYCSPLLDTWTAPDQPYLREDKGHPPKGWQRKGPYALTRAWCLFEVAESLRKGNKMHVALCQRDYKALPMLIDSGYAELNAIFSSVDVNEAQLSKVKDRAFISARIMKLEDGFASINDTVKSELQNWIMYIGKRVDMAQQYVDSGSADRGSTALSAVRSVNKSRHSENERGQGSQDSTKEDDFAGFLALSTIAALDQKHKKRETGSFKNSDLDLDLFQKTEPSKPLVGKATASVILAQTDISIALEGTRLLQKQGWYLAAEESFREIIHKIKDEYGPDHVLVPQVLNELASCLSKQDKHADAEQVLRESLAINKELHGAEHETVWNDLQLLSFALIEQRKFAEGMAVFRECRAIELQGQPDDHDYFSKST